MPTRNSSKHAENLNNITADVYQFRGDIAKRYGLDEAVFLHNLYWWIRKNDANGRHYYDGKNWTYNSLDAFEQLFPFWTKNQIRRIITKLKDCGAIYVGNYNTKSFDRTQWFALSEEVLRCYANSHIEVCKPTQGSVQTHTPIPDNNTDNTPLYIPPLEGGGYKEEDAIENRRNTSIRQSDLPDIEDSSCQAFVEETTLDVDFSERRKCLQKEEPLRKEQMSEYFDKTWETYPRKVSKVQARKTYEKKLAGLSAEEGRMKANRIFLLLRMHIEDWEDHERAIEYIPHFSTWLNENIEDGPKKRR